MDPGKTKVKRSESLTFTHKLFHWSKIESVLFFFLSLLYNCKINRVSLYERGSKKCTWTRPKEQMQNALVHLENELAKIRAGKANPKILNDVLVDYYGSPTPLSQSSQYHGSGSTYNCSSALGKNMLGPIQKPL